MKLITFLLIAFLISCIFTLKKKEQKALKKNESIENILELKNDSLELCRISNRKYIDIALKNK